MALKLDITDEKGVKTRYHKIKSFTYEDGKLTIKLLSYVNQATRDAEKGAIEGNALAFEYDQTTENIRTELDTLSSQLSPNGEGEPETIERIKELSEQVNARVTNPDRPQYRPVVDKYYGENTVELVYFEPLSINAVYEKLASDGVYVGAESI